MLPPELGVLASCRTPHGGGEGYHVSAEAALVVGIPSQHRAGDGTTKGQVGVLSQHACTIQGRNRKARGRVEGLGFMPGSRVG